MLESPNVMLLQIWYNNRLDNSVTSAECQRIDGRHAFNRSACSLYPTVLSQTLVSVAFLSKRPNFRLERNLSRRDEVLRKRSSLSVWFYAVCLIWVGPQRSQFAEICSGVDLLSIRGVGNAEQRLLPTCQRRAYRWLSRVAQTSFTSFQVDVPSLIFKHFFQFVFAYDKKALELCSVWPAGDHLFCCAHTARDFH